VYAIEFSKKTRLIYRTDPFIYLLIVSKSNIKTSLRLLSKCYVELQSFQNTLHKNKNNNTIIIINYMTINSYVLIKY